MDTDLIEAFAGDSVDGLPIHTFYDGSVELRLGMMPWAESGPTRLDVRDGKLSTYFDPTNPANDAFWFFTHRSAKDFHKAFAELGYERRLGLDFNRVILEFWALPDAELGTPLDVNGSFAGDTPEAIGWALPNGAHLRDSAGQMSLVVPESPAEFSVSRIVPGVSAGLYSLDVEIEDKNGRAAGVVLQCQSVSGKAISEYALPEKPDDDEEEVAIPDQRTIRISVLCPDGTDSMEIELVGTGESAVTFRDVRLVVYPLPSVEPF